MAGNRMRIGVDACCWSNRRGFGRFARELLGAALRRDLKNRYVFFIDRQTAGLAELPDAAEVVTVATGAAPIEAARADGRRSLRDLWAMSRSVLRQELDLFFFPAVYSYFPVLNRTRVVVTLHDVIPRLFPGQVFNSRKTRLFWMAKEYLSLKQAGVVLTVSEHSRQAIARCYPFAAGRIRTISEAPGRHFKKLPRGPAMDAALKRCGLNPSDRYLLHVGGISPHKNLKMLVEIFFRLRGDPGLGDLKLILAGDYLKDAFLSEYVTLRKMIAQAGADDAVRFTGYVSDADLAFLYNAAELLVFPSRQEGFGLPAVEAMACGTPVAASSRGSLPEVLGAAGRFFHPDFPGEMLAVLRRILAHPQERTQMRRTGLERAKLFSWETAADRLLEIFADLQKPCPGGRP